VASQKVSKKDGCKDREQKSTCEKALIICMSFLLAPFKKLYSSVDNYIVNSFRMEENLLINNNPTREGGEGGSCLLLWMQVEVDQHHFNRVAL